MLHCALNSAIHKCGKPLHVHHQLYCTVLGKTFFPALHSWDKPSFLPSSTPPSLAETPRHIPPSFPYLLLTSLLNHYTYSSTFIRPTSAIHLFFNSFLPPFSFLNSLTFLPPSTYLHTPSLPVYHFLPYSSFFNFPPFLPVFLRSSSTLPLLPFPLHFLTPYVFYSYLSPS